MHYYYDFLVNLEEVAYAFYEWREDDPLLLVKKVPLVKVSNYDLKMMLSYQVQIPMEVLERYLHKTILTNSKERATMILFTSTKNHVLIEFNDQGISLLRSQLLLEDDRNVRDLAYALKETAIPYKKLQKIETRRELRIASEEKKIIEIELKTIEASKNIDQLSYYYYEWFGEIESDFESMLARCQKELKLPYNLKMHELCSLIQLSYREYS